MPFTCGRLIRNGFVFILIFLAAGLFSACGEEPPPLATAAPEQSDEPTALSLLPTPTLASGAPTPRLPTPPITPTVEKTSTPTYFLELEQAEGQSPEATPDLEDRMEIGERALEYGDYDTAVEQLSLALQQDSDQDPALQGTLLYDLGAAYLFDQQFGDAATMFHQLLTLPEGDPPPEAHFQLAQASMALGEYETAVAEYLAYLDSSPDMAAYVQPLIADAYLALGDSESALQAYEAALEGPAYRVKEVQTRLIIAEYYLDAGENELAVAQYDAIYDIARTEATRGQMTYLAGISHLLAGNTEAAYERFLYGVEMYPEIYESYLGLVELVKGEQEVESYQRGLVDFYAAAYAPGITAFEEHISNNPDSFNPESHRFIALSHEALGDLEPALAELDLYAAFEPADALIEKAWMQGRAGELETAVSLFEQYLEEYPEEEAAAPATWWLASYLQQLGENERAIEYYGQLVEDFPEDDNVAEALFRAAGLANTLDDQEQARSFWLQAAQDYPTSPYGSEAILRLLALESSEDGDLLQDLAEIIAENPADHYHAQRAADIINEVEPFSAAAPFTSLDVEDGLQEANDWMIEQAAEGEDPGQDPPDELSEALLQDSRLQVGQKLWELGLFQEGKWELEDLRLDNSDSMLESYQLALFLREIGLYRSSIIAAANVLNLAGSSVFEAPKAIGRLAYPTYYSDQILPLSEQYGYDPRLQFSLVRQESLFESFATSGAAAQGLSQVIPETGAWIANRLGWPEGYVNEDLYKPYVGLTFGAYYLSEQLNAFDGDVHAALAAYNAGPGNSIRWHEVAGSDIDQFVDAIDFPETLAYVTRIYAGYNIYRYLYGE